MNRDKDNARDPVCGRRMNPNKAYAIVAYNKVEYMLCCPLCQAEFEAEPELCLQRRGRKERR